MKKLELLNNIERAQILFGLFPDHINIIAGEIKEGCNYIVNHQNEVKKSFYQNGSAQIITPELWINLAQSLLVYANKVLENSKTSPKQAANYLFSGWEGLVTIHLLSGSEKLSPDARSLCSILWKYTASKQ